MLGDRRYGADMALPTTETGRSQDQQSGNQAGRRTRWEGYEQQVVQQGLTAASGRGPKQSALARVLYVGRGMRSHRLQQYGSEKVATHHGATTTGSHDASRLDGSPQPQRRARRGLGPRHVPNLHTESAVIKFTAEGSSLCGSRIPTFSRAQEMLRSSLSSKKSTVHFQSGTTELLVPKYHRARFQAALELHKLLRAGELKLGSTTDAELIIFRCRGTTDSRTVRKRVLLAARSSCSEGARRSDRESGCALLGAAATAADKSGAGSDDVEEASSPRTAVMPSAAAAAPTTAPAAAAAPVAAPMSTAASTTDPAALLVTTSTHSAATVPPTASATAPAPAATTSSTPSTTTGARAFEPSPSLRAMTGFNPSRNLVDAQRGAVLLPGGATLAPSSPDHNLKTLQAYLAWVCTEFKVPYTARDPRVDPAMITLFLAEKAGVTYKPPRGIGRRTVPTILDGSTPMRDLRFAIVSLSAALLRSTHQVRVVRTEDAGSLQGLTLLPLWVGDPQPSVNACSVEIRDVARDLLADSPGKLVPHVVASVLKHDALCKMRNTTEKAAIEVLCRAFGIEAGTATAAGDHSMADYDTTASAEPCPASATGRTAASDLDTEERARERMEHTPPAADTSAEVGYTEAPQLEQEAAAASNNATGGAAAETHDTGKVGDTANGALDGDSFGQDEEFEAEFEREKNAIVPYLWYRFASVDTKMQLRASCEKLWVSGCAVAEDGRLVPRAGSSVDVNAALRAGAHARARKRDRQEKEEEAGGKRRPRPSKK